MAYTAELTPREARAIRSFIQKNQKDCTTSLNSIGITSTRITFQFHENSDGVSRSTLHGIGEVYSNYTRENVIKELPKKYQSRFQIAEA